MSQIGEPKREVYVEPLELPKPLVVPAAVPAEPVPVAEPRPVEQPAEPVEVPA
jgi:hypothetical protein